MRRGAFAGGPSPNISVDTDAKTDRIRYLVDVIIRFKRDYPDLPCDLDGFLDLEDSWPGSTLRMIHLKQIKYDRPHPLDGVWTHTINNRPVYGRVTWVMKLGRPSQNVGELPSKQPKDWQTGGLHKAHRGLIGTADLCGNGDPSWKIGSFRSRRWGQAPTTDLYPAQHPASTGALRIQYVILDEEFLRRLERFVSTLIVGVSPCNRIQFDTDPFARYPEIAGRRLHGRAHPPSHGPRTSTEWDIRTIQLFLNGLRDERRANGV
jgi:hypothetical protein